jgi:hypothetical protein
MRDRRAASLGTCGGPAVGTRVLGIRAGWVLELTSGGRADQGPTNAAYGRQVSSVAVPLGTSPAATTPTRREPRSQSPGRASNRFLTSPCHDRPRCMVRCTVFGTPASVEIAPRASVAGLRRGDPSRLLFATTSSPMDKGDAGRSAKADLKVGLYDEPRERVTVLLLSLRTVRSGTRLRARRATHMSRRMTYSAVFLVLRAF